MGWIWAWGDAEMQAMLWEHLPSNQVRCRLCAHGCLLKKGQKGLCGVRVNERGELVTLVGDLVSSLQLDPIEKKPLYHYLPGSKTFSLGSLGCNFHCRFCQNHQISQLPDDGTVSGRHHVPAILWQTALRFNARSVAFTYNEPTVFFEQIVAAATQLKEHGLGVIMVSNGYMSKDCLSALQRRVDAINVDLKSFSDSFYREYCGARLQPVLDNLKAIKAMGWWLEVTTLIIPGCNDSSQEIKDIAAFIRDELGPETPWHLTAFHGAYGMQDHPSPSLSEMEDVWHIGREAGLHYVYLGNTTSPMGGTTFCPKCGAIVIERSGWQTRRRGKPGRCPSCRTQLPGVWG